MRVGVRDTGAPARSVISTPVTRHHRHVAVFEDDHVARVGEKGGNVGGEDRLPLPEPDHHAARAVLGRHEPVPGICFDSTPIA